MKFSKRLSAVAVSAIMMFSVAGINVFAASTTQDGLEVSFTTDREVYSKHDKIVSTLSVKNTNESDVTDIVMETVVPDGYEIDDGSKNSQQLDKLAPNEIAELKVVYVAQNSGENSQEKEISQISDVSITNPGNVSPHTGDNAIIPIAIVLIMITSVVLSLFCFKSKNGRKFLSVMLTISILGSSAVTISIKTNATTVNKMIELQKNVKVTDAEEVHLKSIIKYYIVVDNIEKDISINTDDFTYSATEDCYYVNEETKEFSGKLKHSNEYQTIEYDAFDERGNHVDHDSIKASENWSFENIGLVAGINTIKVKAVGTKTVEEQICLYDPFGYNYEHLQNFNQDTDNDGLLDYVENILGTDINKKDSDGDNLTDYQEVVILGTNPLKTDTDGNNVNDYDEDEDKDGISNGEEFRLGLNPVGRDTDNDYISDYDELYKYHTDPLKADTDDDKADDKWEIDNGFDPLTPQETFDVQKQSENSSVTVQTTITSQKAMTLSIKENTNNPYLPKTIPGYMGSPYDFSVEGDLEQPATISFKLPEDIDLNNIEPVIYYFNEETKQLEAIETEIDYQNGIARAKVSHFSTYILLNKREFDSVWNEDIRKPNENIQNKGLAMSFVIDRSKSMDWNDSGYLRTQLTKNFIDKLDENKDAGSVISFIAISEVLTELTNDKTILKNAVDTITNDSGINSNSGTNGSAGIKSALDQLKADTEDHDKYIIFMTDGEDNRTSYSYDFLIDEANKNGVTIYTIGLGTVNDNVLKKVANSTGGKYYYASEASDLIDIFEQAEHETIDYQTDTNKDGISDYYTRIMCDGEKFINGAYNPFSGYSFDDIQKNKDYDGDRLKNGDEIVITEGQDHVYVQMISDPTKKNSDGDTYSDYDEVKIYNSNPMKTNINFSIDDTSYISNDDNFVSKKYQEFYDNHLGERVSVWIGNNIFSSNHDTKYMYKVALMKYLEHYVDESEKENQLLEFIDESKDFVSVMESSVDTALEKVLDPDKKDYLLNLKQQIQTAHKNMDDLTNGDLINKGMTREEYYKLWDDAYNSYREASSKVDELESSLKVSQKVQKIGKVVGIVVNVVDVGVTVYNFFDTYSEFNSKIDQMADCVKFLEIIKDSNDANDNLKQACTELMDAINKQSADNMDKFWDGLWNIGGKVGHIGIEAALTLIPVVGEFIAIAELAMGIGDFMFNIGSVSEACTYLYAISKSSCILSAHFRTEISKHQHNSKYYHVYSNYKDLKDEYFGLVILEKESELNMKAADEANSFLIEWLFTYFMYKMEDIEKNISKLDSMKFNYFMVA